MSDKTNPKVSVVPTQADREVAEFIMSSARGYGVKLPNDGDSRIQRVASHRLAHQTPPATQPSATVGEDQPYPASQAEARLADAWRFHYGSRCPADCDEVYYRRKSHPDEALGPTPPHLIRWTDTGDGSDILAWHPVYAEFQRRHRLATLHTPPPVSTATVVDAGWQDIASAPKDGTWFLGYWPDCVYEDRIAGTRWYDSQTSDGAYWQDAADARDWTQPTHWRATPTPPAGDR